MPLLHQRNLALKGNSQATKCYLHWNRESRESVHFSSFWGHSTKDKLLFHLTQTLANQRHREMARNKGKKQELSVKAPIGGDQFPVTYYVDNPRNFHH